MYSLLAVTPVNTTGAAAEIKYKQKISHSRVNLEE